MTDSMADLMAQEMNADLVTEAGAGSDGGGTPPAGDAPPPPSYRWQVIGLMVYYMILLFASLLLLFLAVSDNSIFGGTSASGNPNPILETLSVTVLGGLLGGVLYGIRTLFHYYAEEDSTTYDPRWLPKYVTAPFEGAGLAVIVLAVIQSGAAAFGGTLGTADDGVNFSTAFATGAMVGYGTRNVIRWLNQVIESTFSRQDKGDGGLVAGQ